MARPRTRTLERYGTAAWPFPAVAVRLREARLRARMTQGDMGAVMGLSRPAVVNMEQGRQRIGLDHLYLAARALSVTVASLLPETTSDAEVRARASAEATEALEHAARAAAAERREAAYREYAGAVERAGARLRARLDPQQLALDPDGAPPAPAASETECP